MILKLTDARKIHICLLKLWLKYLVIKTEIPIIENQIVKNKDIFHLKIMVTASCIIPQNMNVNSNATPMGKIRFNGLKMNFPK